MAKKVITFGDTVLCDLCNKSYDEDNIQEGGFQFQSKAVCPDCERNFMNTIIRHKEQHYIRIMCPKGMTFRNFVIDILRHGKPAQIIMLSGDDALKELDKPDDDDYYHKMDIE